MDNKFTTIKERILYLTDYYGISKETFFNDIGMTYGNFKGEAKKRPLNSDTIANILTIYPEINPTWLIVGDGEMIEKTKHEKQQKNYKQPDGTPLVAMEAAAGFGSNNFMIRDEDIQGRYLVPDFNGIDFMIRVKGSSMYPKYSSGDIIACRILHNSKFIQWNKCYVVATREQGLLIKRLKKAPTENTLLAISDNKEYDPFEIPTNEITGMALVIGVIRLE